MLRDRHCIGLSNCSQLLIVKCCSVSAPEPCLALAVCILGSACSGHTAVRKADRCLPLVREGFRPHLPVQPVKNAIRSFFLLRGNFIRSKFPDSFVS